MRATLTLAALLLATAAGAQDGGRRDNRPGAFDFYVLALSWSPNHCATDGRRRGEGGQCAPGRRLGFTVHGLWPQYERGFPTDCAVGSAERAPSRVALAEAEGVFPEEGLARHEWRRHGTCSGRSPAAYFREARQARDAVQVPDALRSPDGPRRMTPRAMEAAFAAANPGLRPDMMAVACRGGALQEVRICFQRDLRGFRPCPEVDRRGCGFGEILVEPPR